MTFEEKIRVSLAVGVLFGAFCAFRYGLPFVWRMLWLLRTDADALPRWHFGRFVIELEEGWGFWFRLFGPDALFCWVALIGPIGMCWLNCERRDEKDKAG
jgi:hypothetical protein